ncbi:TraB/GumN family protein [Pseudoduganella sp. RAF53_2]|uniref:TraB/GumN family protein n=1 Tax=unclassified Pseudoduganella TaxID=2637179 RepID=UPI003F947CBE
MRRQIIVIFSLLLGFALPAAWAEAPKPAVQAQRHGALFKLEKGGHTSWLFGTIHVGAPDFFPLEPQVMSALGKSTALALEVDPLGDPSRMMQAVIEHGLYKPGQGPALEALKPDYRPRLEKLLHQYSIPTATVEPMKPWMIASVLTVAEFTAQGYQSELSVDSWLSAQAKKRKIKVVELESASAQMALFDRMTAEEQVRFLEEGIDAIEDKEQAEQARDITDGWRYADQAKLEALAKKAAEDDTFSGQFVQKILLDERNPGLADGIVKLMAREKNSFAAIGVLHLVGSGSVPELLRQRGVSVQRIY